ncbi:hypothetical protein LINPERHAP2_LOCUS8524 [Linum perenne]
MKVSERVREGEGIESRAVSVSGVGSFSDRCCRSFQIKNYRISIEASDGRFGSVCRLLVSKGSSSHFVFLDHSSVLWLEGVLQVASLNNWSFPSGCEFSSPRRTVKITLFVTGSNKSLKISELCSNGKIFYVLIPLVHASEGWKNLLGTLQNWVASALAPPSPATLSSKSPTSYASAVKGASFSFQGRCIDSHWERKPSIKVEQDGTLDRLSYLEGCLVLRFCTINEIAWPSFRSWMSSNWALPVDTPIQKLDDGLWLLFCGSSTQVNRVLALNRRSFKDTLLQIDKWIPEAGRSNVLSRDNVIWASINGIPLHLRSSDLFRHLGDYCGTFLGFELTGSLSSVRIKIKLKGELPESIPVHFGDRFFLLRVSSASPIFSESVSIKASPRVDPSIISKLTFQEISSVGLFSAGIHEDGSSSASSSIPPPAFSHFPRFEVLSEEHEESVPAQPLLSESSEVATFPAHPSRGARYSLGVQLADRDRLLLARSTGLHMVSPLILIDFVAAPLGFKFNLFWEGLISPLGYGKGGQFPCFPSKLVLGLPALVLDSSDHCSLGLTTPQEASPAVNNLFLSLDCSKLSSPPDPPEASSCSSDSSTLFIEVSDMAELFGLEIDGSKDKGIKAATDSLEASSARRFSSNAISFAQISQEVADSLVSPFSLEEIWLVVNSCEGRGSFSKSLRLEWRRMVFDNG